MFDLVCEIAFVNWPTKKIEMIEALPEFHNKLNNSSASIYDSLQQETAFQDASGLFFKSLCEDIDQ